MRQLKYYIKLGAPSIRDYADENQPFIRPEIGFTPSWFHKNCGIDFSEKWHADIDYRIQTHEIMSAEVKKQFPGYNIGEVLEDKPVDLLTGIYGIGILDSIFGRPLKYIPDRWPVCEGNLLSDAEIMHLEVPDLKKNEFFQSILFQLEEIKRKTGSARGFLNWQGNLNTAFRFRGQEIFSDLIMNREIADKLLSIIAETYIQGVKMLHKKQFELGTEYNFATIANCTVNMAGPELYEDNLLPFDKLIAEKFDLFGIHNCAWTATPYLEPYSAIPNVCYIDMGIETDLKKAREIFPEARRNCLYKSVELLNKSIEEIRNDFLYIAENLGPCDVGMPDIEMDVPPEKIMFAMDLCREFSEI